MATDLHATARELVADDRGILAADESSGTIEKRFDTIGLESTEEHRRAYRDMLFTTPDLEEFVSGVILFDETLRQSSADGTRFADLLSGRGIIPGIKVDTGAKPPARRARRSPRASTGCASGWRSTAASARASPSGAP
jgi:fructose-bisphosphate aldolase class I